MGENAKVSKLGNARRGLIRFYKDVKGELKKVIWPNKQQLTNNTATVLAACLVVGAFIWAADAAFGKISQIVFTR